MAPSDFKAWFLGYAATIDAAGSSPSETQWNRLKEQVAKIVPSELPAWVEQMEAPDYDTAGRTDAGAIQ